MLDLCLCVLRKEQMKDRQRQENSNFMLRYCEQPIYGLIFVCFSYILSVCMVMLLLCLHTQAVPKRISLFVYIQSNTTLFVFPVEFQRDTQQLDDVFSNSPQYPNDALHMDVLIVFMITSRAQSIRNSPLNWKLMSFFELLTVNNQHVMKYYKGPQTS